ncbi:MAG: hypothetical protein U1F25_15915 [Rubrivivax sp.]
MDERIAEARGAGGESAGGIGGSAGSRPNVGAAGWLTLVQPGGASVRLLLATGGVTVCDVASGRCEQARLEAAQAQALQRALMR